HVAARGVVPLFRIQPFNLRSLAADDHLRTSGDIVRTSDGSDAIEQELITTGSHHVPALHAYVLFRLITSDHRYADDKDGHAEMRHLHSVVATALRAQFLKCGELS